MNIDVLYSYVVSCGWVFLTGWTVLIVLACADAFRHDQV
jgi:hypothetical protein